MSLCVCCDILLSFSASSRRIEKPSTMSVDNHLRILPPHFGDRSNVEQNLMALSLALADPLSQLPVADEMSELLKECNEVIQHLHRADMAAAACTHSPTRPQLQPTSSKLSTFSRPASRIEGEGAQGAASDRLHEATRYLVAACRAPHDQSVALLRRGSSTGSRCADVEYAIAVALGADGEIAEAFGVLDKAIAAGHPGAMLAVANCLREGRGVPSDPTGSVYWLRHAAELGHVIAQHELAEMYEIGFAEGGIEKSLPLALRWYKRAATVGYAPSALNLGKMMLMGSGVDVGELATLEPSSVPSWMELLTKSTFWLSRAARDGNTEARQLMDRISRDGGQPANM